MFKLYKRSQLAQYRWIRNHPVQFIILNVSILALQYAWYAHREYKTTHNSD